MNKNYLDMQYSYFQSTESLMWIILYQTELFKYQELFSILPLKALKILWQERNGITDLINSPYSVNLIYMVRGSSKLNKNGENLLIRNLPLTKEVSSYHICYLTIAEEQINLILLNIWRVSCTSEW